MQTRFTLNTFAGNLGTWDFGNWAAGLASAFIGGGAGAVVAGPPAIAVDPTHFNLLTSRFWTFLALVFLWGGLLGFMAKLREKPLPDHKVVTDTTQKTSISDATIATSQSPAAPRVKTVETHTEVSVEPADKKPESKEPKDLRT